MSEEWRACLKAGDLVASGSEDFDNPSLRWCLLHPPTLRLVKRPTCLACAVPTMFAALEATREFLCEAEIDSKQEAELLRCMSNLDAAIAAARGEG